MMPVALKIILTLAVDATMFGGLVYVIYHIRKHPEEWFFWKRTK